GRIRAHLLPNRALESKKWGQCNELVVQLFLAAGLCNYVCLPLELAFGVAGSPAYAIMYSE
uniref:hypothetical protein n=1 Tax=Bartonella sp. AC134YNZD TaxID=3243446 RepID=UPI0035D0CBED